MMYIVCLLSILILQATCKLQILNNEIFSWTMFYSAEGNEYLREQGIEYETDFDLWQNIMALLLFALFFLFMAYVQLRRMKKLKWD